MIFFIALTAYFAFFIKKKEKNLKRKVKRRKRRRKRERRRKEKRKKKRGERKKNLIKRIKRNRYPALVLVIVLVPVVNQKKI